ncbi:methylated-DNA--[protein]-cysteine S-methyltransferase [Fodinibius sp.]|uniref:methylated-DNA--[protein]-cysteine S-methyltransferase n=1 Tax=Fodinibius sp. TaxID=1872440 RepID=UPI002ACE1F9C|nr:methylated-DNA--[protein]-cysteine S-methyltransferase [Fodinibius sp.]MDZ7659300.1 methylated-DNA--[protein]-cysteine S-methyltransferase [Fodinibius sp.]
MSKDYTTYTQSPLGPLQIKADEKGLTAVNYCDDNPIESPDQHEQPVLTKTIDQLNEYFEGKRKTFDIPLVLKGTNFQQKVWKQLQQIPYGQTITYSELASRLGDTQKARAVAGANGLNPIPIIIPCHRVIGADNKLTGYSGGIERKQFLLQLEGALLL